MRGDPGRTAWVLSWGTEAGAGGTRPPCIPVIAQETGMGCLFQVGGSNECGSLEQKDKAVPGMARITQEKLGVPKPRRPAAEIPY